MSKCYTWTYHLDVAPYDRLIDVLEAFFASYPEGDYAVVHRERYKLQFRRGLWKKAMLGLGDLVPDRLVKGDFKQWPTIVRVLVRPSPSSYATTINYEVHLPKSVSSLGPQVQTSVDQHAQRELKQLADYLAECIGLKEPPTVQSA